MADAPPPGYTSTSMIPSAGGIIHAMHGGGDGVPPPGYQSSSLLPSAGGELVPYRGGSLSNALGAANKMTNAAIQQEKAQAAAVAATAVSTSQNVPSNEIMSVVATSAVAANKAAKSDAAKSDAAKSDAAKSDAAKSDAITQPAVQPAVQPDTKPHTQPIISTSSVPGVQTPNNPANKPVEKPSQDVKSITPAGKKMITLFGRTLSIGPSADGSWIIGEQEKEALKRLGVDEAPGHELLQKEVLQALYDGTCDTDLPISMLLDCEPIRRLIQSLSIILLEKLKEKSAVSNVKKPLPTEIQKARILFVPTCDTADKIIKTQKADIVCTQGNQLTLEGYDDVHSCGDNENVLHIYLKKGLPAVKKVECSNDASAVVINYQGVIIANMSTFDQNVINNDNPDLIIGRFDPAPEALSKWTHQSSFWYKTESDPNLDKINLIESSDLECNSVVATIQFKQTLQALAENADNKAKKAAIEAEKAAESMGDAVESTKTQIIQEDPSKGAVKTIRPSENPDGTVAVDTSVPVMFEDITSTDPKERLKAHLAYWNTPPNNTTIDIDISSIFDITSPTDYITRAISKNSTAMLYYMKKILLYQTNIDRSNNGTLIERTKDGIVPKSFRKQFIKDIKRSPFLISFEDFQYGTYIDKYGETDEDSNMLNEIENRIESLPQHEKELIYILHQSFIGSPYAELLKDKVHKTGYPPQQISDYRYYVLTVGKNQIVCKGYNATRLLTPIINEHGNPAYDINRGDVYISCASIQINRDTFDGKIEMDMYDTTKQMNHIRLKYAHQLEIANVKAKLQAYINTITYLSDEMREIPGPPSNILDTYKTSIRNYNKTIQQLYFDKLNTLYTSLQSDIDGEFKKYIDKLPGYINIRRNIMTELSKKSPNMNTVKTWLETRLDELEYNEIVPELTDNITSTISIVPIEHINNNNIKQDILEAYYDVLQHNLINKYTYREYFKKGNKCETIKTEKGQIQQRLQEIIQHEKIDEIIDIIKQRSKDNTRNMDERVTKGGPSIWEKLGLVKTLEKKQEEYKDTLSTNFGEKRKFIDEHSTLLDRLITLIRECIICAADYNTLLPVYYEIMKNKDDTKKDSKLSYITCDATDFIPRIAPIDDAIKKVENVLLSSSASVEPALKELVVALDAKDNETLMNQIAAAAVAALFNEQFDFSNSNSSNDNNDSNGSSEHDSENESSNHHSNLNNIEAELNSENEPEPLHPTIQKGLNNLQSQINSEQRQRLENELAALTTEKNELEEQLGIEAIKQELEQEKKKGRGRAGQIARLQKILSLKYKRTNYRELETINKRIEEINNELLEQELNNLMAQHNAKHQPPPKEISGISLAQHQGVEPQHGEQILEEHTSTPIVSEPLVKQEITQHVMPKKPQFSNQFVYNRNTKKKSTSTQQNYIKQQQRAKSYFNKLIPKNNVPPPPPALPIPTPVKPIEEESDFQEIDRVSKSLNDIYYKALGVSPSATKEEIERAYRVKILKKSSMPIKEYRNVVKAYNTLINPVTREDYDLNIGVTSPEKPTFGSLTNHLDQVGFDATKPSIPSESEPAVASKSEPQTEHMNSLNQIMSQPTQIRSQKNYYASPPSENINLSVTSTITALEHIIGQLRRNSTNFIGKNDLTVQNLERIIGQFEKEKDSLQKIKNTATPNEIKAKINTIHKSINKFHNSYPSMVAQIGGKRQHALSFTVKRSRKRSTKRTKKQKRLTHKRR